MTVGDLDRCITLARRGGHSERHVVVALGSRSQRVAEPRLGVGECDAVLGARGPGEARLDGGEVERRQLGEHRLRVLGSVEQSLLLGVGLDQGDVRLVASGEAEIAQRHVVDREDHACGPVLGCHVADGGAVLERELRQPGAMHLHELADDPVVAQQLGDGEHEVGGGRSLRELSCQAEPDDGRDEHREWLPEHGGFRLDATHAPAEHAQSVDHRGVRVGAHQGVGERLAVVGGEHHAGEVFEVHLVTDTGARRYDAKAVECLLCPPQELVALDVAPVLDLDVGGEGRREARGLRDDRVVDDELDGDERVDGRGVTAHLRQGIAHGRQVDHPGDAGEVLHEDSLGGEGDLRRGRNAGLLASGPSRHGFDVGRVDLASVFVAEQVLEEHLHGVGQAGDVEPAGQCVEPVHLVGPVTDGDRGAGGEAVD